MDKKTAICRYLYRHHRGKRNAVYSRELERLFSIDGRNLRRKISALRQDGYPICSEQYVQLNQVLIRSVTLPPTIKSAIESKLKQEQEALEYEFKLEKAAQEAERQRVEAEGKAKANSIVSASITDKILRDKGIEATLKLAESPNSKVVVIGGSDGMPIILGDVK